MMLASVSAPFWKVLLGKLQLFGAWLAGFGLFGVLLLAYVDSVIPLTPIPDATLALLCAQGAVWWWWAAAVAAVGSSLGCMTVYWLVRRLRQRFMGRSLLARRLSPERQARIEALIRRYDIAALAAAAVMPPPFPFKPFVICAGLLEFHQGRLFLGLFIGRALRYGTLAYLSMRYGSEAMSMLQQHTGWFFLGVGALVAILGAYLLVRWYVLRRPAGAAPQASLSPDIRAQDA
ncbi:MAG: VTT domain-containing protein [Chloracidobacterium sp.]|uniref:VTT domain-containing protein n=1 Tax=Chloracidobacterium validum TaxID=2821543 RepID=A0ABX8BCA8_9BACT|nr:VTT domain-containing protein [Chloracidobacterium validum]QUW04568.1 VTT domain-containing protein [Chloracidobacterium validum]